MKYLSRLCSLTPGRGLAWLAILLFVLALVPVAQATVTTVSYWRMGEADPGAFGGAFCSSTTDLVGGRTLLFSSSVFWDSGSVGASAVARVGSTFGLRAYGAESAGTNAAIPSLTDNFGLELWVNPVTLTGNQCLAYNGNSGSSGWGLYLIGNQFQGLFGGIGFVGAATATANTWTHLALVRNNGTTTLYVNGVAAGSLGTTPISPSGRFAVMGQPQNPTQERLDGFLDEVRVFTFAPGTFSTNDLLLFKTTRMVTTVADAGPGSLRWAITNLNAGGVAGDITFAVNGTIALASDLPAFTNSVTITGPGTNLLTISGGNSFRLFQLAANTTNSIGGLTMANGFTANNNSGAALYNLGSTVVTNCLFTGNTVVGGFGGAVANFGNGTLLATNCTFANNTVRGGAGVSSGQSFFGAGGGGAGMGGAIFTEGAELALSDCTFQANVAAGGAGGDVVFSGATDAGGTGGYPNPGAGGTLARNGEGGGFGGGGGGSDGGSRGGPGGFGGGAGGSGSFDRFASPGGAYGGTGGILYVNPSNSKITSSGCGGGGAGLGGGMFARTGNVSVANCAFAGNAAIRGLAGFGQIPAGNGQGVGGAIFVLDASLNLVNPTFSGNTASTSQPNLGASTTVVNTNDSGAGSLRQAVFVANNAGSGTTITFAPALSGQTITLTSGQLTLSNNLIIDASSLPGGIALSGNNSSRVLQIASGGNVTLESLTLKNGFLTGAAPAGAGAGILVDSGAVLTVNRSTIASNTAAYGGGIYCLGGTLKVNNSTFTGNSATGFGFGGYGGGFYLVNSSATVNHSTIAGNVFTAGPNSGAGGLALDNSAVSVTNSILAGNSAPDLATITGGVPNGQNNLIGGSPLLAPLGNYGGPTQTMPPLPGSPAIDAATGGTSFTIDQRGKPRLVGAFADLGAVEGVFNPEFPIVNFSKRGGGNVQFAFTNLSGPGYRVLASTNVAAPLNQWSNLGAPTEAPAGVFNFTDPGAPAIPSRFYRVTTP